MASTPDVFAHSAHSSREPSLQCSSRFAHSAHSSREPSPQFSSRSCREDAPGVLANFLLGRPRHAFGADALPRTARGTTAISHGRVPPGGISVLGSPHYYSEYSLASEKPNQRRVRA